MPLVIVSAFTAEKKAHTYTHIYVFNTSKERYIKTMIKLKG